MTIRTFKASAARYAAVISKSKTLYALLIVSAAMYPAGRYVDFVHASGGSSEYRVFLRFKTLKPVIGSYTVVSSAFKGKDIIKKVIGKEGDVLDYRGDVLCLNAAPLGVPYKTDSAGAPLQPVEAQTIGKGFLFIYLPHHLSFDSRYRRLGLVHVSECQGRAYPLF